MPICANCKRSLKRGDRYCRFCGAKRSPKRYAPEDNILCCVYGPPYSVKCTCKACGYSYIDSALGVPHKQYFCPKCGGACSVGPNMDAYPDPPEMRPDDPRWNDLIRKILSEASEEDAPDDKNDQS